MLLDAVYIPSGVTSSEAFCKLQNHQVYSNAAFIVAEDFNHFKIL